MVLGIESSSSLLLGLLSFFLLLGINVGLTALGLTPTGYYLNTFLAASLIFVGMLVVQLDDLFNYRNPLVRFWKFAVHTSGIVLLLVALRAIVLFSFLVQSLMRTPLDLGFSAFLLLDLSLSVSVANMVNNHVKQLSVNRTKDLQALIARTAVAAIVIETLSVLTTGSLDYLWLALFGLSACTIYLAQPGGRLLSNWVIVGFIAFFALNYTLGITDSVLAGETRKPRPASLGRAGRRRDPSSVEGREQGSDFNCLRDRCRATSTSRSSIRGTPCKEGALGCCSGQRSGGCRYHGPRPPIRQRTAPEPAG